MKKQSKSLALASKVIFAAFEILKENGGELNGREVLSQVEQRVDLDDWAKARFEKSGYIRWQSVLHFYSIDCVKAGFLIKKKGTWYLTKEGEEAMKLGPEGLLSAAQKAYRQWKKEKEAQEPDEDSPDKEQEATIDEMEQIAVEGLKSFIKSKNPYQFQDLAAALLRGMGYYTPFVAPSGKDGGVDIIAYRDPLGTVSPRIKVQIKHRDQPVSAPEIRQLMGLLQKDGDVGIFISSGGFTSDSKTTARSSHVHVELIDLSRFIELWQEFYHKLSDEDKSHLPLLPIYFYSPTG
ncbi:restriction endonuclease [Desulfonatronospira sp.]|uniref:restriction endonuclease n=1 Tax=Desulfonatronospira sp. TaxID=1962951 RepID=UPI0025B96D56|nr:restriction endonuclease [Desulfonatronospira sp.]